MDPPEESTVRHTTTATRGDTKRVSIDPPAAMAGEDDFGDDFGDPEEWQVGDHVDDDEMAVDTGEEWHPEDPEEVADPLAIEEKEPCYDEEEDPLIDEEDEVGSLEDGVADNDDSVVNAHETHKGLAADRKVDDDEMTVVAADGDFGSLEADDEVNGLGTREEPSHVETQEAVVDNWCVANAARAERQLAVVKKNTDVPYAQVRMKQQLRLLLWWMEPSKKSMVLLRITDHIPCKRCKWMKSVRLTTPTVVRRPTRRALLTKPSGYDEQ